MPDCLLWGVSVPGMRELFHNESRARLRSWLTIGYTAFIVYGSLSPFTGWREQGLSFSEVLRTPFQLTYTGFDAVINLLAYLPFGFLLALTLRARIAALPSVILSLCAGTLLSAGMEYLQMYLPARTSSNLDLLNNSLGALAGALLAVSVASWTRLFALLTRWRNHHFRHGKEMDFGLALLALWMFGQVNPSLPMLGSVFITEMAHQPFLAEPPAPFIAWESSAVTLNLLMLGTLLTTLLRLPNRVFAVLLIVLALVALAKFIAATLLLKSWALLVWINSEAVLGMLTGALLLTVVLWLPRMGMIVLGAAAAMAYFAIANFVLDSSTPSSSMSIYHWHYGHLLNYNGLAQTIMLIFPLLLLFHLWRIRNV